MAYQSSVKIEDTLLRIERHEFVLPVIQRESVWKPVQFYSLFDRLMQGYSFGTFLEEIEIWDYIKPLPLRALTPNATDAFSVTEGSWRELQKCHGQSH